MNGVVSKLYVERGERVVGTSQMAGTEMLRIADFEKMEVLVDVNENDIVRIRKNDTALVEVDAYPGRKFEGVVTQNANSAKNIGSALEQVTNFEVKVYILPSSYADLVQNSRTNHIQTRHVGLGIYPDRNPPQCIGHTYPMHHNACGTSVRQS
jgi:HlyD family secretion protein